MMPCPKPQERQGPQEAWPTKAFVAQWVGWAGRHPGWAALAAYLGYRGLRDVGKGAGRALQDTRQPSYLEQPGHAGYKGF